MRMRMFLVLGAAAGLAAGVVDAQSADEKQIAESIVNAPDVSPREGRKGVEITAESEANFDSSTHTAVFVGNVVVKDPRFELRSDTLTVDLNTDGGGFKRAKADGNVTIIQQEKAAGSSEVTRSVGRSASAVYEPATGNVILIGWPQVQQGINLHRATVASTKMTLNKNGKMQTDGPSMTIIVDKEVAP